MIRHKKGKATKKTYVAYILDKSGSMESIKNATISSFNEQIQEQKLHGRKGGDVYLSLFQFSSNVEETFFNVPLQELEGKLDEEQYTPQGTTALYDAIGQCVSKLQKFDESGDVAFLVVIISDGMNNVYKKYSAAGVSTLRKELTDTGRWTFQYIGCDGEAVEEVKKLGINSFKFDGTIEGTAIMSKRLRSATANYYTSRSEGALSVSKFME